MIILDCYNDLLGTLRIIIVIFFLIWLGLDVSILGLRLFIFFHDDCSKPENYTKRTKKLLNKYIFNKK